MAGRDVAGTLQQTGERPTASSPAGAVLSAADRAANQSKEAAKLRQIIQHFFTKAALTIVSSRVDLPQCFYRETNQIRSNRWFNLILDESDILAEDVEDWASIDVMEERPPALTVEIYLDTQELTRNQSLVVVDERNRRWDVCEALATPGGASSGQRLRKERPAQVVLERWTVFLDDLVEDHSSGPADSMPNIYKKAVVLFRSLYTYCRFLPAWKFGRRLAKQQNALNALRPMYRIVRDGDTREQKDLLSTPLYPSPERTVDTHHFKPTKSPAGLLSIQVSYRTNCNFRIDDSEALLSSRFMGMEDHYFQPSLGSGSNRDEQTMAFHRRDVGSLPSDKRWTGERPAMSQAYGSMSTFHNTGGPRGTSPISALRAAGEIASESPPDSASQKGRASPRLSHGSKLSAQASAEGEIAAPSMQRRVSVSFQPFKAGSLSSSPVPGSSIPQSPISRPSSVTNATAPGHLTHTRNRTSLSALPQTALRIPPVSVQSAGQSQVPTPSNEVAVGSPSSGSPKATPSRYSSSFINRRSRLSSTSTGAASKIEEDNSSSGRASQSSSTQPGSGILADADASKAGTPPNFTDDDDKIQDFLKLLEQKKELKSFQKTDEFSRDASARRTSEQLSRFQKLRESHSALTESMSSSTMLQRSSNSSSRQLSSVPPGLVGNSVSSSSSPGKPVSPHTPHTPAIPSRLSAGANTGDISVGTSRSQSAQRLSRESGDGDDEEERFSVEDAVNDGRGPGRGTTAIDIPTSPRQFLRIRRPDSTSQRRREVLDEFDHQSASIPIDDRPDISMGDLLMHDDTAATINTGDQRSSSTGRRGPQSSRSERHPSESNGGRPGSSEAMLIATTSNSSVDSTLQRVDGGTNRRRRHTRPASPSSSTTTPAGAPQQHVQNLIGGARQQHALSAPSSGERVAPATTLIRPRLTRGGATGRGSGGSGSSRFSFGSSTRPGTTSTMDDDEPLLFTLSELGSQQSTNNLPSPNLDDDASTASGGG